MPDSTHTPVPPIAELRQICQASKLAGDRRWWYVMYRRVSIYITWALLHTSVTPNQVTAVTLILVVSGAVLTALQCPWIALAGYALLMGYHLLDKVDGEIARFRGVFSIRGVYMDELGHAWVFAGLYLGATIRLAPTADNPTLVWILGIAAGLAMVLIRSAKSAGYQLFSQYVLKQPALLDGARTDDSILTRQAVHADRAGGEDTARRSPVKALAVFARNQILVWSQFLVALWLFLVGMIIELATGSRTFLITLLIVEGIFQTVVYALVVAVNIKANVAAECAGLLKRVRDGEDS